MNYYLDTNICIYYLKGIYENIKNKILEKHPDQIKIPVIVKAELLLGAEKSENKNENITKIKEFLLPFEIIPFTDKDTTIYAKIRADLEKKGMIIGPYDLLIATIVKANDGILVSNNITEFKRIKELRLENWVN